MGWLRKARKQVKRTVRKVEKSVSTAAKQVESGVSTAAKQVESEASRAAKRVEDEARRIRNQAAGLLGMGGAATQGSETAITLGTLGMGRVGEEEDKAKKDKKKSNTLSKKKFGTRGAIVPLQSTKTISGDSSTKGVQI